MISGRTSLSQGSGSAWPVVAVVVAVGAGFVVVLAGVVDGRVVVATVVVCVAVAVALGGSWVDVVLGAVAVVTRGVLGAVAWVL